MEIINDGQPDEVNNPMAIKSVSKALQMTDQIMRFFQQHIHGNLYILLKKVSETLQDIDYQQTTTKDN